MFLIMLLSKSQPTDNLRPYPLLLPILPILPILKYYNYLLDTNHMVCPIWLATVQERKSMPPHLFKKVWGHGQAERGEGGHADQWEARGGVLVRITTKSEHTIWSQATTRSARVKLIRVPAKVGHSAPSGCSALKTSQSKELSPRAVQALKSLQARRDERLRASRSWSETLQDIRLRDTQSRRGRTTGSMSSSGVQ
jgi:hypothetical protein